MCDTENSLLEFWRGAQERVQTGTQYRQGPVRGVRGGLERPPSTSTACNPRAAQPQPSVSVCGPPKLAHPCPFPPLHHFRPHILKVNHHTSPQPCPGHSHFWQRPYIYQMLGQNSVFFQAPYSCYSPKPEGKGTQINFPNLQHWQTISLTFTI